MPLIYDIHVMYEGLPEGKHPLEIVNKLRGAVEGARIHFRGDYVYDDKERTVQIIASVSIPRGNENILKRIIQQTGGIVELQN